MLSRQSELFISSDWKAIYKAFTNINFNASDPGSINSSMREYLRTNYAEDFNDWIESSEFVAIIDLLAYLAGILAYKTDLGVRENFMESASARESILRLARFLSYMPSRARPASGLLKIVEISSDDDLTDSTGRSLTNRSIVWNSADDQDWYDNFTTVLNSALINTNPIGSPLNTTILKSVNSHMYRINSKMGDLDSRFSSKISGNSMNFEIVNCEMRDGIFSERTPDLNSALHLINRNDGNGNSSPDTGFFFMFKQGMLHYQNSFINTPIENMIIDIIENGVTEDDIWVNSLSDNGIVTAKWKRIPSVFYENTTFNSLDNTERNIFSVITRTDDKVSLRFSDGIFGNAPVGNISISYRTCNGLQYSIKPLDINRITIPIPYTNRYGVKRTLKVVLSNYSTISNASIRETDADIKKRAPAVYSTQGRMVNGEDYNVFPLSSNLAVKLKAVNRTYSGHSRHIDLNDPTSTYQDTSVFADDGIIYIEDSKIYSEIPVSLGRSSSEIVTQSIMPFLKKKELKNYVHNEQISRALDTNNPKRINISNMIWENSLDNQYSFTGWFNNINPLIKVGSSLLFSDGKWANVSEVNGIIAVAPSDNSRGPVTLTDKVSSGSSVVSILPYFNTNLSDTVRGVLETKINLGISITLWFDPITSNWLIRDLSDLNLEENLSGYPHAIKLVNIEFVNNLMWRVIGLGHKLVFESERKIKWFSDSETVSDSLTGAKKKDTIKILSTNSDLKRDDGKALLSHIYFNTEEMYYHGNGVNEPRKIIIGFVDDDEDGVYDSPDSYYRLISLDKKVNTLFWKLGEEFGNNTYIPIFDVKVVENSSLLNDVSHSLGDVVFSFDTKKFYLSDGATLVEQNGRSYKWRNGRGRNTAKTWYILNDTYDVISESINYHWKHFVSMQRRVDISVSNVMDIFVLSSEYDFITRQWIADGAIIDDMPEPPSELDLKIQFRNYETAKISSDEIIWRPVRYKLLFGESIEDQSLRARFKVVKLSNGSLSDGEIKSRIIRAINKFFDVKWWEFGQTFYFTELSAFVHQQLSGEIASFVIVPLTEDSSFGDGFEVKSLPNEIFISTAQVSDIEIIESNTSINLRMR